MADTRPNDLPDMMLGEKRLVEFIYAAGAGLATLNSATFSCIPANGVTFSTVSPSGSSVTPMVTAVTAGRYKLLASGVLSSGEEIKLAAYVNITDPNRCHDTRDDYE